MDKDPQTIFLCDSDPGLSRAAAAGAARIAVRHSGNRSERLMAAPWMVESPRALCPEFLNEVLCRHYKLPLTIAESRRCLLRELTLIDLDMLWELQLENAKNPPGSFFPQGLPKEEAAPYLQNYIKNRYPFYGYGIYAILLKGADMPTMAHHLPDGNAIGIAGFSENSVMQTETVVEVGYSVLKAYQNQGLVSEILPELIRYGRDVLGLDPLVCRVKKDNSISRHLAGKYGLAIIDIG